MRVADGRAKLGPAFFAGATGGPMRIAAGLLRKRLRP